MSDQTSTVIVFIVIAAAFVSSVWLVQNMYMTVDREETQRVCIQAGGSYNDNTCFLQ